MPRPSAPRAATGSARQAPRAPRAAATQTAPPSRGLRSPASGATPRVRRDPRGRRASFGSVVSWRLLVMLGVLGLAFALVAPSVRVYLNQQSEIAALAAERDSAKQEVADLNAELQRWEDPAFIIAQARDRLQYVMPGETPYRVIDPELAQAQAEGSLEAERAGTDLGSQEPWFNNVWDELEAAGNA